MKTFTPLPATAPQKQCIHRLARQRGLDEDEYRDLIRQYSNGRTTTSAELYKHEATELIGKMIDPDGKDAELQRKKHDLVCRIYRRSCEIAFLNKDYDSDDPNEVEMNKAKINVWLRKRGACKKDISRQSYTELQKTLKQLETIKRNGK